MNRAEAAQVLELRQHLWPHTPKADDPAAEVKTWATLLAAYEPAGVVAAMRSMRAEAFPPTLGQIEEALNPIPHADEVWTEFARHLRAGYSTLSVDGPPWSSPLVRTIAAQGYWRRFGEAPDPTYDEFAPANHANARKAFAADVGGVLRHERRVRAGLASPVADEIATEAAAALPAME